MSIASCFKIANESLYEKFKDKIESLEVAIELCGYKVRHAPLIRDSFSIYRKNELLIIVYIYSEEIHIYVNLFDDTIYRDWKSGIDEIIKRI